MVGVDYHDDETFAFKLSQYPIVANPEAPDIFRAFKFLGQELRLRMLRYAVMKKFEDTGGDIPMQFTERQSA
jgi:hypothetical protein